MYLLSLLALRDEKIKFHFVTIFFFFFKQIDLVAWLAQYMESHGIQVDLRDHCGHSPLHLAARAGHASAVAILVAHGADVTAKVFICCFHFYFIRHEDKHIFYFPSSFQSATHPETRAVCLYLFFKFYSIIQNSGFVYLFTIFFLDNKFIFYILAAVESVGVFVM